MEFSYTFTLYGRDLRVIEGVRRTCSDDAAAFAIAAALRDKRANCYRVEILQGNRAVGHVDRTGAHKAPKA